jgi:23S rRNA (uracil1939-C5)-methyltransferase
MAFIGGFPLFIAGTIPGQEVRAVLTKHHGRYGEARLLKVVKTAPGEIKPRCKHFFDCGGCLWQHLPYERQILYKEQIVRDTLEHVTPVDRKIRKTLSGRVLSIIPSPQVFYYRNKLELSFGVGELEVPTVPDPPHSGGGRKKIALETVPRIGFHQPGRWATVLPVTECHLYDEQISSLLLEVQRFLQETRLPVYNPRNHRGVLRSLLLRRGINTGEQMVCFLVQARKRELEPLFQHFMRFGAHPHVTALLIVEHFGLSDRPSLEALSGRQTGRMHVLKGEPYIRERLMDLEFELSPFSFFQTNTLAAEKLHQVIGKFADLSHRETVLDCYCGIGAIGQYLSRFAQKVVGVESAASAVEDALRSAGKNRIGNISFYKGLAEEVLSKQLAPARTGTGGPAGKYTFNCVVLDPPRAGLHKNVISATLAHEPEKIIYVSCNTATFARDLAAFLEGGTALDGRSVKYELRMVQPVDLFPHTAHVETVALLQRG